MHDENEGIIEWAILACHEVEEAEGQWECYRCVGDDDGEDSRVGGCSGPDIAFMSSRGLAAKCNVKA
jgi:hypothetical protein